MARSASAPPRGRRYDCSQDPKSSSVARAALPGGVQIRLLEQPFREESRYGLLTWRKRFQRPLVREIALVAPQRHQTDVVGTSGQVRVDTRANLLLASPCDHLVNQAIAAAIVEVCSRKSLREQDALVVLLIRIKTEMLPRPCS